MKINGTYIHTRGVSPDEAKLMQRAVVHYQVVRALVREHLRKELVESGTEDNSNEKIRTDE